MTEGQPIKFTPSYKSEWNMGEKDFERFHKILSELDIKKYKVTQGSLKQLFPYFSLLHLLYMNMRAIMRKDIEKDIRSSLCDIEKFIDPRCFRLPKKKKTLDIVIKQMYNIHEMLLEEKQRVGIGIPVRKQLSDSEKARRAFK